MTLISNIYSAFKKLFHICDHRWVEVRRDQFNSYYVKGSYISPMPVELTIVIELKCSRCGDIKFKKIKP